MNKHNEQCSTAKNRTTVWLLILLCLCLINFALQSEMRDAVKDLIKTSAALHDELEICKLNEMSIAEENTALKERVRELESATDLSSRVAVLEDRMAICTDEYTIAEGTLKILPSEYSTIEWNEDRPYQLVDCPLTAEQQDYIYVMCEEYDISFYLFMALLDLESDYNVNCISDTNDYGIAQINICNHKTLQKMLGFDDIMEFHTNIHCGLIMLRDAMDTFNDDHLALTCYNKGPKATKALLKQGYTTSSYSRAVMKRLDKILGLEEP